MNIFVALGIDVLLLVVVALDIAFIGWYEDNHVHFYSVPTFKERLITVLVYISSVIVWIAILCVGSIITFITF